MCVFVYIKNKYYFNCNLLTVDNNKIKFEIATYKKDNIIFQILLIIYISDFYLFENKLSKFIYIEEVLFNDITNEFIIKTIDKIPLNFNSIFNNTFEFNKSSNKLYFTGNYNYYSLEDNNTYSIYEKDYNNVLSNNNNALSKNTKLLASYSNTISKLKILHNSYLMILFVDYYNSRICIESKYVKDNFVNIEAFLNKNLELFTKPTICFEDVNIKKYKNNLTEVIDIESITINNKIYIIVSYKTNLVVKVVEIQLNNKNCLFSLINNNFYDTNSISDYLCIIINNKEQYIYNGNIFHKIIDVQNLNAVDIYFSCYLLNNNKKKVWINKMYFYTEKFDGKYIDNLSCKSSCFDNNLYLPSNTYYNDINECFNIFKNIDNENQSLSSNELFRYSCLSFNNTCWDEDEMFSVNNLSKCKVIAFKVENDFCLINGIGANLCFSNNENNYILKYDYVKLFDTKLKKKNIFDNFCNFYSIQNISKSYTYSDINYTNNNKNYDVQKKCMSNAEFCSNSKSINCKYYDFNSSFNSIFSNKLSCINKCNVDESIEKYPKKIIYGNNICVTLNKHNEYIKQNLDNTISIVNDCGNGCIFLNENYCIDNNFSNNNLLVKNNKNICCCNQIDTINDMLKINSNNPCNKSNLTDFRKCSNLDLQSNKEYSVCFDEKLNKYRNLVNDECKQKSINNNYFCLKYKDNNLFIKDNSYNCYSSCEFNYCYIEKSNKCIKPSKISNVFIHNELKRCTDTCKINQCYISNFSLSIADLLKSNVELFKCYTVKEMNSIIKKFNINIDSIQFKCVCSDNDCLDISNSKVECINLNNYNSNNPLKHIEVDNSRLCVYDKDQDNLKEELDYFRCSINKVKKVQINNSSIYVCIDCKSSVKYKYYFLLSCVDKCPEGTRLEEVNSRLECIIANYNELCKSNYCKDNYCPFEKFSEYCAKTIDSHENKQINYILTNFISKLTSFKNLVNYNYNHIQFKDKELFLFNNEYDKYINYLIDYSSLDNILNINYYRSNLNIIMNLYNDISILILKYIIKANNYIINQKVEIESNTLSKILLFIDSVITININFYNKENDYSNKLIYNKIISIEEIIKLLINSNICNKFYNGKILSCRSVKNYIIQNKDNSRNLQYLEYAMDNNYSIIDINECLNQLKDKNILLSNKETYLNIVELNLPIGNDSNKYSNIVYNSLVDINNNPINILYCKYIDIMFPYIGDNYMLGEYYNIKRKTNEKSDIYDKYNNFYLDKCINISESKFYSDITLNYRSYLFTSSIICSEGCNYNGINNKNNYVICRCNSSEVKAYYNYQSKYELKNNFDNNSYYLFGLLECYNKVFANSLFINNGFWLLVSLLIIFILVVLYIDYNILKLKFDYLHNLLSKCFSKTDNNKISISIKYLNTFVNSALINDLMVDYLPDSIRDKAKNFIKNNNNINLSSPKVFKKLKSNSAKNKKSFDNKYKKSFSSFSYKKSYNINNNNCSSKTIANNEFNDHDKENSKAEDKSIRPFKSQISEDIYSQDTKTIESSVYVSNDMVEDNEINSYKNNKYKANNTNKNYMNYFSSNLYNKERLEIDNIDNKHIKMCYNTNIDYKKLNLEDESKRQLNIDSEKILTDNNALNNQNISKKEINNKDTELVSIDIFSSFNNLNYINNGSNNILAQDSRTNIHYFIYCIKYKHILFNLFFLKSIKHHILIRFIKLILRLLLIILYSCMFYSDSYIDKQTNYKIDIYYSDLNGYSESVVNKKLYLGFDYILNNEYDRIIYPILIMLLNAIIFDIIVAIPKHIEEEYYKLVKQFNNTSIVASR